MGGVKSQIGCTIHWFMEIIAGTLLLFDGKKDCGIRAFAKEVGVSVADPKNKGNDEQNEVRKWSRC